MARVTQPYRRSFSSSLGSGMGSVFGGSGRKYYILEHKNGSRYHRSGESQEIIIDQVEIGRDPKCQVRFDDSYPTVSRRHAAIVRSGDKWKLVQLSTTNPTFLNGSKVDSEWYLQNGDEIQLSVGGPRLGFILPQGNQSTVGSLKLTRRLSLFRQQALQPYKQALVILSIVLGLVLAGSLGYGIYSYQKQEKLLARNAELATAIAENNKKAESLAGELGQNKEEMEALQKETEALVAELNQNNAQTDAYKREVSYMQNRLNNVSTLVTTVAASNNNKKKATAPVEEEDDDDVDDAVAPATASRSKEAPPTAPVVGDINALSHYVFAIIPEKTVITFSDGSTKIIEEQLPVAKGSGFLLEDGRFITARHVLEPWYYYEILKDEPDYLSYNKITSSGGKVVRYFTAISSSGKRFTFNGSEAKINRTTDKIETMSSGKKGKTKEVVRKGVVDDTDWAVYQTHETSGFKFNNALATTLPIQAELGILGFPWGRGAESIQVTPIYSTCQVARQGLDVNRTIMVSNDNTEKGNDGGPVLIWQNGEYQVIGILSGSTFAKGRVVPVSATNNY